MLKELHKGNKKESNIQLKKLKEVALKNNNIFKILMDTAKVCSLEKITNALYEVGGQYRRNM